MIQLPICCLITTPLHLTPVYFTPLLHPPPSMRTEIWPYTSFIFKTKYHDGTINSLAGPSILFFVCTQWHKFFKDSIGPLSKFYHLEQSSSPPSMLGLSLIYINFKIYTLDAIVYI